MTRAVFVFPFLMLLSSISLAQSATELEAQYGTCAKHHIPADKCTPEIYQQLKAKDDVPLDPTAAAALKAVKEFQPRLKNPSSMQLRVAYVTDKGDVCLEIAGQNTGGGMSLSRVVYTNKGKWLDEGGYYGAAADGYEVNRWPGHCLKVKFSGGDGARLPGTDVTEKVNQALKASQ